MEHSRLTGTLAVDAAEHHYLIVHLEADRHVVDGVVGVQQKPGHHKVPLVNVPMSLND